METETITGEVKRIIFRNRENGWTVLELLDNSGDEIAAVGALPLAAVGERVEMSGWFVEHPSYGRQFRAQSCISVAPATLGALQSYLGSGLIKGVGEVTARNIVQAFGMDTLTVLEQQPERLSEIPGIGRARAKTIAGSFFEQRAMRDVMMGLQKYGITVRQGMRLYQLYGAACLLRVEEDPYSLVEDVEGIGFKTADKIAMRMGVERESRTRLRAGVSYMLIWARQEGHTYLPRAMLLSLAADMLEVEIELVEDALDSLILDGSLKLRMVEDAEVLYLPSLYHMERDSALRLMRLTDKPPETDLDIARELTALEASLGITLAPLQRDSVRSALTAGAMVITGGPGTGKTTILQFILHILVRLGLDFALCAPTGRAAKRMAEATGFEASTIHRLLEYGGEGRATFARNEENPLYFDMVVVDEMSMVDLPLFYALLRALPAGVRLVMVGDADQLPPVGAGTVLHDIIRSGRVEVIRLSEIYRQSERGGIARNAHAINAGRLPDVQGYPDFRFLPCASPEEALTTVLGICANESSGLYVDDPYTGIQVLSPTRKGPLGVRALNARLQEKLNPAAPHKAQKEYADTVFREGDKVMQIKNNYKLEWMKEKQGGFPELGVGVYNGDLGAIMKIDAREQTLTVLFDDARVAQYAFHQLEELELAYCISIHKSQGSEFPVVVLPLFGGPPVLMTRNLLYTAITRARSDVLLVGSWRSVREMVENTRMRRRYSALHVQMEEVAPFAVV